MWVNIQMIWLASIYRLHGYLFLVAAGGHSGRGDHYRVRACLFLIIMIIVMIRLRMIITMIIMFIIIIINMIRLGMILKENHYDDAWVIRRDIIIAITILSSD